MHILHEHSGDGASSSRSKLVLLRLACTKLWGPCPAVAGILRTICLKSVHNICFHRSSVRAEVVSGDPVPAWDITTTPSREPEAQ
jgi:hypothetical protein